MKAALAGVLLWLVCAPLQAQTAFEKPREQSKAAEKPAVKSDRARPPVTRETTEGPVKLDRVRPEPRPSTPPSPAQQYQQQQYEQRQVQQNRAAQPNPPQQSHVVQCTARPVCGGAGYGRCAAVSQSFPGMTAQAGRREIVQRCIDANTPDSCNCAAQCTAVARCSIF